MAIATCSQLGPLAGLKICPCQGCILRRWQKRKQYRRVHGLTIKEPRPAPQPKAPCPLNCRYCRRRAEYSRAARARKRPEFDSEDLKALANWPTEWGIRA